MPRQAASRLPVRQLDALRRAGRARGVDERQQVVGADRAPARVEVEPGRAPQLQLVEGQRAGLAVDDRRARRAAARPARAPARAGRAGPSRSRPRGRPSRAAGTRSARVRSSCRPRRARLPRWIAAASSRWNSLRFVSSRASVSPRRRPSECRPSAMRRTRSPYSCQLMPAAWRSSASASRRVARRPCAGRRRTGSDRRGSRGVVGAVCRAVVFMRRWSRPGGRRRIVAPTTRFSCRGAAEGVGELRAGVDVELLERVREVGFDRAQRHEQRLGDLAVR